MNRLAAVAALVLTVAGAARAQSGVVGKWQGVTGGDASLTLDLTVKGTALTGTLTRDGQKSALSDGKVSGNAISFKATLNDKSEGLSGELKNDELHVWLDRQGPSRAIVLTRVKARPPQR